MKISTTIPQDEGAYLAREYSQINYDAPPMQRFLDEIYTGLRSCGIDPSHSVLDVGCGRGYLLRYLNGKGHRNLLGLDPCAELVRDRLHNAVRTGAFFEPGLAENSYDVVITCHTLHHLRNADPMAEIAWMKSMARQLVVIVEINNTNLPMLLMSLLHWRVEANAFRYNLWKSRSLCRRAGLNVLHARNMNTGYISGSSVLHALASDMGSKPYNLVLARP